MCSTPEISPEHLLHRRRDETLDLLRRRARERNEDVGERDVDLRLFFARRHQHGEDAHQQRRERQQRRQLTGEEPARDPPAEPEPARSRSGVSSARRQAELFRAASGSRRDPLAGGEPGEHLDPISRSDVRGAPAAAEVRPRHRGRTPP